MAYIQCFRCKKVLNPEDFYRITDSECKECRCLTKQLCRRVIRQEMQHWFRSVIKKNEKEKNKLFDCYRRFVKMSSGFGPDFNVEHYSTIYQYFDVVPVPLPDPVDLILETGGLDNTSDCHPDSSDSSDSHPAARPAGRPDSSDSHPAADELPPHLLALTGPGGSQSSSSSDSFPPPPLPPQPQPQPQQQPDEHVDVDVETNTSVENFGNNGLIVRTFTRITRRRRNSDQ